MADYSKMGNELALKLMVLRRVREPTLCAIQENAKESVHANKKSKSIPAWLFYSKPHPGLPDHYIVKSVIESDKNSSGQDDDISLPTLPFKFYRDILYKLIIIPEPIGIPSLFDMKNGTIIIVGRPLPDHLKHNIEILLYLQSKLLPVCYCPVNEVITKCPVSASGRTRCYYAPHVSSILLIFVNADEKIIHRTNYRMKWLSGNIDYHQIELAIVKSSLLDNYNTCPSTDV